MKQLQRKPHLRSSVDGEVIGDLYTLEEFGEMCGTSFQDYDGHGRLATTESEFDFSFVQSAFMSVRRLLPYLNTDGEVTHVMWYNR